jgi:dTDP-4-amino-4,6-dideoxygalactose transaminase
VHAAIGLAQLQKLERFNAARISNARFLSENLQGVTTPTAPEGRRHVFHQYTIRVPDGQRDALREVLSDQDIGTGVYYPVPVHQQDYYVNALGYDVTLPEAEQASAEVLSLPVHPALSDEDLEAIVAAVNGFVNGV